jgi:hypothetical protein
LIEKAHPVAALDRATSDLVARMEQVLAEAPSRGVCLDVVFATLKLDALDWAIDQQLEPVIISTSDSVDAYEPATVDRN